MHVSYSIVRLISASFAAWLYQSYSPPPSYQHWDGDVYCGCPGLLMNFTGASSTIKPHTHSYVQYQFSHKISVRRTKQIQPHLYPPTPLSSTTMLSMKHEDYTVGWICALPTELAAAVGMLDERHSTLPSRQQDNNTYSPRGS